MSQPYPIVSQSQLKEPSRHGIFGLSGLRRADGEVPSLNPDEVLVYRVNGHFVVDDGRWGRDDSRVVNASSVSLVSMRRGADVEVTFEIASMDAAKFTLQVNFVCSVVDPITVVRDGQKDACSALRSYLKGYQPLFELGLKHPLAEINAVRREAGLHVKAFMASRPPQIPGLSIALGNVQVMTPQELAGHEELRRRQERERILAAEREHGQQALKRQQTEGEHLRKLSQMESDHLLGRREREYHLEQASRMVEAQVNGTRGALLLAHLRGELTAEAYAQQVRGLDDEDWRRTQEITAVERAAQDKAEEIARADAREQAAIAREDRRQEIEWDRADQREREEYERALAERRAIEEQERRKREVDVELEILREFNKRGLLDNYYPDINDMMRRVRGEPGVTGGPTQVPAGNAAPELPSSSDADSAAVADDPKHDDLREEDGY